MKKKIDLILACSDLGVNIDGTSLGPEIISKEIDNQDINAIKTIKPNKEYVKDKSKSNKEKNLNEINKVNEEIYTAVKDSLNDDCFPLTIGGDHSIVIGSALASIEKHDNLGIIWFDAHGDYHTLDTTESGNIHGLPFAVVTGYEKRKLSCFQNRKHFDCKKAVVFGARDIDMPHELNNLKDAGVTIITTEDIKQHGIEAMCKKAFDIVSNGTNGVHISLDIDCIDPKLAKGVSVPVIDGLDLSELNSFLDYAFRSKGLIKSMDVVEYNPLRDKDGLTKDIAINIVNKVIKNI